jgi:hypothetical protein
MEDSELRQKMMAIWGGMWGIYLASYGNGVLGQIPTGSLLNVGMAIMFLTPHLSKQVETND